MHKFQYIFVLFFVVTLSFGQNSQRKFISAQESSNGTEIKVNDGVYQIKLYTSKIVETTFIPNGEDLNSSSHAVVLAPQKMSFLFENGNDKIVLHTKDLTVNIQKQPFQISYWYNEKQVISEKLGYSKTEDGELIQFNLTTDEVLYGGGARALGMNRRGHRLQLYNKAHYGYETQSELMNFTIPIVMSSNQYMVHFDNAPIGYLDLDSKKDNTLTYQTISGRKTYQVIVGNSWLDVIDNYTDLTGKQPMPPRWALGNFSSRFGYHSQNETLETINKFKEEKIPVDAIILDLYWFGKEIQGTMGNLEFDRDSFPNPKQMIKDLKANNVETILITEPFMLTTSSRWQEAVDANILAKDSIGNPFTYDFYFGNTGLIDIYNPKGKQWFWNIYKELAQLGVTGLWGDLGEPEVHPSNLIHDTGTADEVHNIYGHDWARLIHEGYKTHFSNQRPFILMRAGYSGSQRFGMIPWSGDVNRTWGGLQSQTEIALQMGMQGMAYMHSDLGGFAGANLDDELYARWLQYGVFQPIYRPHAQEEVPSEPVFRSEKAKTLAKAAIELRYSMLPYNYNLVFENNQTGAPLMRPLFFQDHNEQALTNASQYFWGHDFLVKPILNAEVKETTVSFPENSNWFNFYSDKMFKGGETEMIKVEEGHIPTFVRGGAFIPTAKPMQSTKAYTGNDIMLHYYFDSQVENSESSLYNDDGLTANAFEKGAYEILEFEAELEKRWLVIEIDSKIGKNYAITKKQIELIIHNIQAAPKQIKINDKKVKVSWDTTKNTLSIPLTYDMEAELIIKIKR